MFAPPARSFGEVLALAGAIADHVLRGAIGLGSYAGFAIGQQLHIAMKDEGDGLVDPPMTLWQGLLGPLSDLGHSLAPCLACGLLETRSTCLFPRDLFYCYHCSPFIIQRVLYLAV